MIEELARQILALSRTKVVRECFCCSNICEDRYEFDSNSSVGGTVCLL